jgi:hypothetical protein
MFCTGFIGVSSEDVESFCKVTSVYPISVGTLSEVIPDACKLPRGIV